MTDMPELQVVPVEDLDKIEKLLDVALSCVEMPHLSAIKNACMEELAQINAALEEAQGAALETYNKEMADWNAAQATAKKKEEEAASKKGEAGYAKERNYAS
jgi:lantibiotic modifying enzyme